MSRLVLLTALQPIGRLLCRTANQSGKQTSMLPPLRKGRWIGGLQPSKTEGPFYHISLEFLKLLSAPRSSSLCSADSSPCAVKQKKLATLLTDGIRRKPATLFIAPLHRAYGDFFRAASGLGGTVRNARTLYLKYIEYAAKKGLTEKVFYGILHHGNRISAVDSRCAVQAVLNIQPR